MAARVSEVLAAGGVVWAGDETTVREFPPLHAAWARRGEQATVTITGRNGRRVVHGALNVRTGERVQVVRPRQREADVIALVEALGARRVPDQPWLLVWDNAPAHKTTAVRTALAAAGMEVAWLPFRSPELNPCEDLWRQLKRVVAANRVYPTLDELAERAVAWLDALSDDATLTLAGLRSSKFNWLPT